MPHSPTHARRRSLGLLFSCGLTHPIDIILFRHLRYVVIIWKREGSTGQRRIPITKL